MGRQSDRLTPAHRRQWDVASVARVGGVDISFQKGDAVRACAALVVLDAATHSVNGSHP
jgi:deoxyinosine 3'endonuclease (endonuclease V)